jgi:hypothetical protein
MNNAIKMIATLLGISAGVAGLEHGYFEVLQGTTKPAGLFIASIGSPCDPEVVWNACEPALTIIPNFLVTGILSIIIGLVIIIWSIGFVQRTRGGLVLILLSIALLFFGGGLFPPFIGVIAGVIGTRINKPLTWWQAHAESIWTHILAKLHPWAVIIYLAVVLGQFIVGYFFNDFLSSFMGITVLLILTLLLLSILSAFAHDAQKINHSVPAKAIKQY